METAHLEEFVYLAETLSFKLTAEHFYVSRSVISRHLAALEETLGAKLVERSNHVVELTEIGEAFYREAKAVLRDVDRAVERVREIQQSQTRVVRVGYLRNAARPVIVFLSRYMRENHPDLTLSLSCMEYNELRHAMEDGVVDVALAVNVNPAISRNYRSTLIYQDRFYAVMSKEHPLAARESVSLEDLPDERLLLPDSFVYAGLSDLIDGLVESQTRLVARAYYSDIDMLYLKVQTEGYVAFSSSMNNAMFGDNLAIVPVIGVDSTFSVSAFYSDALDDVTFVQCREGFEACRDTMAAKASAGGASPVGISMANFD